MKSRRSSARARARQVRRNRRIATFFALIIVAVMCVLCVGARFNASDVEVNPSAVDEVVATAEPEVVYVAPVATATPAPAAIAPAATPAPVATAQPVEEFPISVLNGNSNWGPYWVNPMKAELTVEPAIVAHIDSLASYADNGWFTAPYHTVDSIDESQLSEVAIYGASLPNVGDANLRSEDQGKTGTELARALYSYILRIDGSAWTLKAEEYDRCIHILVGFLKVGQNEKQYWTVWENHTAGYYCLCYVKAGSAPVVEQPTWTAPQQPTQPTQPTDPQPTDPQPTDPPEDTHWTFVPVDEPPVQEDPIDWGDGWDDPAPADDTDWTFQPVEEDVSGDTGINWGSNWEDSTSTSATEDTNWTFQPVVEVVSEDTGINWGSNWEDSAPAVADTNYTFTSTSTTSVVVESAPAPAPAAAPVVEAAPAVSAPAPVVEAAPAPAADTNYTFDGGSTSSGSSDIDWGSADEWAD